MKSKLFFAAGLFLATVVPATGQPRLSLQVQRLDFKGNLLRLADGHFVAEKDGELFRLTPEAQFERKLDFTPDRPLPGIIGAQTYFERLLAPRNGGGFLASVTLYIPGLGWIERRLASFDADGRLVESFDTSRRSSPIVAVVELPDGRVLHDWEYEYYRNVNTICDPASLALLSQRHGDPFPRWDENQEHARVWGCARVLTLQGTNALVAGNLYASNLGAVGLLRLKDDLGADLSFHAAPCTNISQLAVQSDRRILARGQLMDDHGRFESDVSVFQLNADGSFGRRLVRAPDYASPPVFSVATNDEILIMTGAGFSRHHPDGTLAESGVLGGEFIPFDAVELLTDGSFLAPWSWGGDAGGGKCLRGNHWVGFRPNGSVNPSFPPAPFDLFDR